MQDLFRAFTPPPHDLEHWVQLAQLDQAPSTSPAPEGTKILMNKKRIDGYDNVIVGMKTNMNEKDPTRSDRNPQSLRVASERDCFKK